MSKEKRDYSKLKAQQLAMYNDSLAKQMPTQIVDLNEPGYKSRTYEDLKRIKFPLILDEIGRTPWTQDEVVSAMMPAIKSLARHFSGKRAGFQEMDAESLGQEAVLNAMWKDRGMAWFAGYAYEWIRAAIERGAKTSGLIRTGERQRKWRDSNIISTEAPLGEGDGTMGETIGGSLLLPSTEECGDWYDEHGRRIIRPNFLMARPEDDRLLLKKIKGKTFVPTCNKGKMPDGSICDRCGGRGRIVVFQERKASTDPLEEVQRMEKVKIVRDVWARLMEGLTEKQREIVILRLGLDNEGRPRDDAEVAAILMARHGMGSKNRVAQVLEKVIQKFKEKQASDRVLTNLIDRVLGENPEPLPLDRDENRLDQPEAK